MRRRPMREDQVDEAQGLYAAGLSLTDIGVSLDVDRTTVRRHLLQRGLVLRSTST